MNVKNWTLASLLPLPSMNEDKTAYRGTYAEAVAEARKMFARTGRRVAVRTQDDYYDWWFVTAVGETNRNQNTEV